MKIKTILGESIGLVKREPKALVPRLLTTAVYTGLDLYIAFLAADMLMSLDDPAKLASHIVPILVMLAFMPLLLFLDMISYAMYPSIVADHKGGSDISLMRALKKAFKALPQMVAIGLLVFAFSFILALVGFAALVFVQLGGNILITIPVAAIIFAATMAFSVIVFFIIPHAIVGGAGLAKSFTEGISLSIAHKWPLLKLNILFFLLAAVSMVLVSAAQMTDQPTAPAVIAFLIMRLIQAIVYTYICVANPVAYFEAK